MMSGIVAFIAAVLSFVGIMVFLYWSGSAERED
jgi:hypothetical protein